MLYNLNPEKLNGYKSLYAMGLGYYDWESNSLEDLYTQIWQ